MPLPCPGPAQISLVDIQNEFGGSNSIGLNEYYRNGGLVPSNNTSVPTSGTISFGNFFCAVNEIVVYITATTTNVNLQSLFEATYPGSWAQTVPKRVVVNSGVIVGATDTSNYALNIPSGFGGTVKVDNNGSIQGAGGASNGGNGGPAILAGAPGVTINNLGTIYGGGGGGGTGGAGGTGTYTSLGAVQALGVSGWNTFPGYGGGQYGYRCQQTCVVAFPSYSNVYAGFNVGNPYRDKYCCVACCYGSCCDCCTNDAEQNAFASCCYGQPSVTNYTAGGAGGAGGVGQGYNQAATNGVGGSAGGTNAGTGGTGGTGGTWGTSGNTGGTGANGNNGVGVGGSGGGAAGYYIVNNGNVTWTTTGTRLGGVG